MIVYQNILTILTLNTFIADINIDITHTFILHHSGAIVIM